MAAKFNVNAIHRLGISVMGERHGGRVQAGIPVGTEVRILRVRDNEVAIATIGLPADWTAYCDGSQIGEYLREWVDNERGPLDTDTGFGCC